MLVIFIDWIVFTGLEQKTNLEIIKMLCENKDFCGVVMLSEYMKILEFNQ